MRDAFLYVALGFCVMFAGMTAVVAAQSGVDIFSLAAVAIVVMLMLAVVGAIRNPPDD